MTSELFFISVAARMLGMHPQTLRKYERLGLIQPSRTIVLFGFGRCLAKWRRRVRCRIVHRSRGLRGGGAFMVAVGLPPGRQTE